MRRCCEDINFARRKHGLPCAKSIRKRMEEFRMADVVTELSRGRSHQLTGDRKGQMAVKLTKGERLVFEPAGEIDPSIEIDWSNVSAIRIVYIGNYHD